MAALDDLRSWGRKQGAPFNLCLIASLTATSLLFWFTKSKSIEQFAVTLDAHQQPWKFLTYPWADMPFYSGLRILCFAFMMMWLFMAGNTIEKQMGTVRYAAFWFISTAVIGIVYWAGMQVLNVDGAMMAAFLPISAVTMVWCARNMTAVIMLYGIIPLSGKWLAVIDIIITVLLYGNGAPLLGAFAAAPLVVAFFYGRGSLPGLSFASKPREVHATRAQARYDDRYYDDVRKREQEREERERLRKLFEGSIKDDKE